MNENKFAIFRSVWFWWLLTTAVYVILGLSRFPGNTPSPLGYIAGFLGLFVPYGLMSLILFFSPLAWFSLVVFIILMIFADRKLNRGNFSLGKRILLNLLILLVLTTLVDLIRGTAFVSWIIFFQGAHPYHCC